MNGEERHKELCVALLRDDMRAFGPVRYDKRVCKLIYSLFLEDIW